MASQKAPSTPGRRHPSRFDSLVYVCGAVTRARYPKLIWPDAAAWKSFSPALPSAPGLSLVSIF
jgi:hypothetical protein